MNKEKYYLGIDAGGSKSLLSLYSPQGVLVNEYKTQGGSLRLGAKKVYELLIPLILKLCDFASITTQQIQLGISIAGTELQQECQALEYLLQQHHFSYLKILSDAHSACLAAHQGKDGICVIIGTGIIAFQCYKNHTARAGGFGFPHDDVGSGAWLGMRALRYTFQALDQRIKPCFLTQHILNYFANDIESLITFANQANASQYAKLAPLVIEAHQNQNARAHLLLKQSAKQVETLLKALHKQTQIQLAFTLLGGISPFILPLISQNHLAHYQAPLDVPQKGVWYFLKNSNRNIKING